jgi:hypothetical protein
MISIIKIKIKTTNCYSALILHQVILKNQHQSIKSNNLRSTEIQIKRNTIKQFQQSKKADQDRQMIQIN